jgi:hypothetical protein
VPSVLLVAAPGLFAITNPNHSFSKLIAKPHFENTLNAFVEWAQNKNAKHVPQSVAEPFNWQRALVTGWQCVISVPQCIPSTVQGAPVRYVELKDHAFEQSLQDIRIRLDKINQQGQ